MLILEYISTHGTTEWCAARMSARASKGPLYRRMSNSVHHAQACIGSIYAWPEGPTPAG